MAQTWRACLAPTPLLIATGLCLLITETNLTLNLLGYSSSVEGIVSIENPGLFSFFRMLAYAALAIAPLFWQRRAQALALLLPFCSILGTALVAMSLQFDLGEQIALKRIGIAIKGLGFPWFLALLFSKLAEQDRRQVVVFVISSALIAKTLLGTVLSLYFPREAQGTISLVFLFACAAIIFTLQQRQDARRQTSAGFAPEPSGASGGFSGSSGLSAADGFGRSSSFSGSGGFGRSSSSGVAGGTSSPSAAGATGASSVAGTAGGSGDSGGSNAPGSFSVFGTECGTEDRTVLLLLVAIFAVALSTMGVMSDHGIVRGTLTAIDEGAPQATSAGALWVFGRLALATALIILFAWFFLGRHSKRRLTTRMHTAFSVVLAGFFIIVIARLGSADIRFGYETAVTLTGVFVHILFWFATVAAMRACASEQPASAKATLFLRKPLCQPLCQFLRNFAPTLPARQLRVIGTAEALSNLALLIWVTFLSSFGAISNTIVLVVVYGFTLFIMASAALLAQRHKAVRPEDSELTTRVRQFAQHYRLSPRETEVFALLARGYTRAMITEQLVISDSTAKTHITHIYEKMNVHSRQELFELLLAEKHQG